MSVARPHRVAPAAALACALLLSLSPTGAPLAAAGAASADPPPAAVDRASLGIVTRDPEPFELEMWRLEGGAWVVKVRAGGAAQRAGVALDDIITAVDDDTVTNSATLVRALGARKPGDQIRLRVVRSGHPVELSTTLGATR